MSAAAFPETEAIPTGVADDDVAHYYCDHCANPDLAVCGVDISNYPEGIGPDELICVICSDWDMPCPVCGLKASEQ